ncbi:MAG: F0F1 ATP synthase subunit B [Clostridiales bacterium]|nr:F0F1 ATP synthase subunit B [Clostridia bacterium]MCR5683052.1 F0F1 ATP synthase subunit B [Clostridiales bacterium]
MDEYLELISLNVWHVVASIANLLILTLILKKFLFKPVQKILAARQDQVDELYDAAEKTKASAEEDKKLYTAKIAGAVEEAESILRSATQRADRQSDEIIADAHRRAAETMKRAEEDIELAKKKAMDDLKNEISDISVQIAEGVVGRELNGDDHRDLIDSFIDKL